LFGRHIEIAATQGAAQIAKTSAKESTAKIVRHSIITFNN